MAGARASSSPIVGEPGLDGYVRQALTFFRPRHISEIKVFEENAERRFHGVSRNDQFVRDGLIGCRRLKLTAFTKRTAESTEYRQLSRSQLANVGACVIDTCARYLVGTRVAEDHDSSPQPQHIAVFEASAPRRPEPVDIGPVVRHAVVDHPPMTAYLLDRGMGARDQRVPGKTDVVGLLTPERVANITRQAEESLGAALIAKQEIGGALTFGRESLSEFRRRRPMGVIGTTQDVPPKPEIVRRKAISSKRNYLTVSRCRVTTPKWRVGSWNLA